MLQNAFPDNYSHYTLGRESQYARQFLASDRQLCISIPCGQGPAFDAGDLPENACKGRRKDFHAEIREIRVDTPREKVIMRNSLTAHTGTTDMKTYMAKTGEIAHKWHVVDAEGKILGRLATKIATVLMGKNKPEYTPHVDTGDFVIVINAEKIKLTGAKTTQKSYESFSGYPGGRRVTSMAKMLEKHPERVVEEAVRRMLPKNRLGRSMFQKLKVHVGTEHPHQAQQPEPMEIE